MRDFDDLSYSEIAATLKLGIANSSKPKLA
jgi:hypothetical protein